MKNQIAVAGLACVFVRIGLRKPKPGELEAAAWTLALDAARRDVLAVVGELGIPEGEFNRAVALALLQVK